MDSILEAKRKELLDRLAASADGIKGVRNVSLDILNTVVPPSMEHKLPSEVKDILDKAKNSFNLKDVNMTDNQGDINKTIADIHNLTRKYASRN